MTAPKHGTEGERRRAAQDELLVEALAAGSSYGKAGEVAGITSRTVARRMADDSFARRVAERRDERVAEVTGQLVAASSDAVRVIHEQCLEAERPADRLRAASLLLTLGMKFRQVGDSEDRLRRLEEHMGLVDHEWIGSEPDGE